MRWPQTFASTKGHMYSLWHPPPLGLQMSTGLANPEEQPSVIFHCPSVMPLGRRFFLFRAPWAESRGEVGCLEGSPSALTLIPSTPLTSPVASPPMVGQFTGIRTQSHPSERPPLIPLTRGKEEVARANPSLPHALPSTTGVVLLQARSCGRNTPRRLWSFSVGCLFV